MSENSMLPLFVLLTAKLLICCNLIDVDSVITTFAVAADAAAAGTTNATKVSAVTTNLLQTNQLSNPQNWLKRQRRYLLFEKGATVLVQANIAKIILPERPRGCNEIFEYTFNYELPYSLEMLSPQPKKAQQTKAHVRLGPTPKTNATTSVISSKQRPHWITTLHQADGISNINNNNNNNNNMQNIWHATPYWPSADESAAPWWQVAGRRRQRFEGQSYQPTPQQQQQQQYLPTHTLQRAQPFTSTSAKLSKKFTKMPAAAHPVLIDSSSYPSYCTRRNVYGNWRHTMPHVCVAGAAAAAGGGVGVVIASSKKTNDADYRIDENVDEYHFATNAERVFFDLLGKWADIHNYPAQHCLLRTFCEARHLLAVPGQSLMHDLIRILIDAALPASRRHARYKKAIWHDNLNDCTQQYATLCGLSFLQYLTEVVHGRFM
ncbi:uncharacterized protein LOC105665550 [Ceratitis capitata]|uniref:uncharacterized protein LOC105665550 n=1 Tax=Ceratitis capitata TaxID=7213 RepID=UPI000618949D|nr:uncharacterized protein LOC105665550 [Ceratitis capitata]